MSLSGRTTVNIPITLVSLSCEWNLRLSCNDTGRGDIATKATRDKLTLHVGDTTLNLGDGTLQSNNTAINWSMSGLS